MAGNRTTVNGPYHGSEQGGPVIGTGYVIGDGYTLTAGHVVFEWNRNIDQPVIVRDAEPALDFKNYGVLFIASVQGLIDFHNPDHESELVANIAIEGQAGLPANDAVLIAQGGTVHSDDDGLVVFLN